MRILISGANGFVGQALCDHLTIAGHDVVSAVRRASCLQYEVIVGNIDATTDWHTALTGCEAVINLAARVHVKQDDAQDSLALYRAVNTGGTLNLAYQAAVTGVQRFIFISSIKVNGEETPLGRPFTEEDKPAPQDAYAVSKWEAEQGLRELAEKTGMEVVIIRPPLVYGPGVKANFATMMQWLNRGMPLPLAAISNRRSLVALDNLVDMIATCLNHPTAVNQTFLVADGEDLSTTELLERTATALGRSARLFSISQNTLKTGLKFIGKGGVAQRLCSSLQVDISKARILLGWAPPVRVDESLTKTAKHFLDLQSQ